MYDKPSWSEKTNITKGKGNGWQSYLLPENMRLANENERGIKGNGPSTEAAIAPDSLYKALKLPLKR